MQRITPIKKAGAGLGARRPATTNLLKPSYQRLSSLSSLKVIIGGLLLFEDKNEKEFWPSFDAMVREYVDLRLAPQSVREKPGTTNAGQGVVG